MIDLLWLVLRAASLVLTVQAAGMALFMAAFAELLADERSHLQRFAWQAALAAAALLVAQLLIEPLHLAGDWSGVGAATLRIFVSSSATLALCVCLVGIACVALAQRPPGPPAASRRALAALASLLAVGSFALTGHTAAHRERALLAPLLYLHVAIVAFWFGALLPLRLLASRAAPAHAARVIAAFSRAAVWLVPLIALAGAALALLLLPDLAALRQPYGLLLLSKATLFAIVMGVAALNRQRLLPALARAEPSAAAHLVRSIGLEYLLLCIVLAATAVMSGALSPGDG
jgi:putative copper export protein